MDAFEAQYGYAAGGDPTAAAPGPAAPGPTPPGMNPQRSLMGQVSPEQLQQLMKLGVLDDKGKVLQDQMAMAQALRTPGKAHQTALGGAFGAAADMVNAYHSKRDMDQLRQQQQGVLDEKTLGREQFAKLWGY